MGGRFGRTGRSFGASHSRQTSTEQGYFVGWGKGMSNHPDLDDTIMCQRIQRSVHIHDRHVELESMLMCRHDIIHLLSDLPSPSASGSRPRPTHRPPSPALSSSSSWDSIPSDLEETFHLSDPAGIEEYERKKRIRRIEMLREARLKEREEEDKELEGEEGEVPWPENEIVCFLSHPLRSCSSAWPL